MCYQCRAHSQSGFELADVVAPISYAVKGLQAMNDLYQYKDPGANLENQARAKDRIFSAFYASMTEHLRCISALHSGTMIVATVPSSGGRQGAHPLDDVRQMFTGWEHISLSFVGPTDLTRDQRRRLDPTWYKVDGSAAKRHVLLIDDTWVSGVRVHSCAAALKQAGASHVSAVTFGRYMDPSFTATRDYLSTHKQRPFDPSICPLTGTVH